MVTHPSTNPAGRGVTYVDVQNVVTTGPNRDLVVGEWHVMK